MADPPQTTLNVHPLVLVVDDDEDTRLNLSDILELEGYRVEVAGSARELLSRPGWDDVSLVLLDRKLPDGTPREIVPLLRRKAPDAAVIIVTGYADMLRFRMTPSTESGPGPPRKRAARQAR